MKSNNVKDVKSKKVETKKTADESKVKDLTSKKVSTKNKQVKGKSSTAKKPVKESSLPKEKVLGAKKTPNLETEKIIQAVKEGESDKIRTIKSSKHKRLGFALATVGVTAVAATGVAVGIYYANQNQKFDVIMYYQSGVKDDIKANNISDLQAPVVEGYTFIGWYKDAGYNVPYAKNEKIEKSCSIYGKYIPNQYKIEFTNSNDAVVMDQEVEFDKVFVFPTPEEVKEGHTFYGWALNKDEINSNKMFPAGSEMVMKETGDLKFYPIYRINSYTVSINFANLKDGNNVAITPTSVTTEKPFGTALKELLRFDVKYTDYSKVFKGYQYTVNSQTYYITKDNLTANDYVPAANISITPWLENAIVEVKFNFNDGTDDNNVLNIEYNEDNNIENLAPTRDGYKFKGWARSTTETNLENIYIESVELNSATDTGSLNLYAIWAYEWKIEGDEENSYVFVTSPNVDLDSLTAPTKINHQFDGYYIEGLNGEFYETYTITEETPKVDGVVVFKKKFTAFKQTINYNLNNTSLPNYVNNKIYLNSVDVSNGIDSSVVNYDENGPTSTYTLPTLEMKDSNDDVNYTFSGWATSANGNVLSSYELDDVITEDKEVTLYSIWQIKSYDVAVEFNSLEGSTIIVTNEDEVQTTVTEENKNSFTLEDVPYWTSLSFDQDTGTILVGESTKYKITTDESNVQIVLGKTSNNVIKGAKFTVEIATEVTLTLENNKLDNGGAIYGLEAQNADGSVALTEFTVVLQDVVNLPTLKDGNNKYNFIGWATDPAGNGIPEIYEKTTIAKDSSLVNKTIYAIWEAKETFTVSFAKDESFVNWTLPEPVTVNYGDSVATDENGWVVTNQMTGVSTTYSPTDETIVGKNKLYYIDSINYQEISTNIVADITLEVSANLATYSVNIKINGSTYTLENPTDTSPFVYNNKATLESDFEEEYVILTGFKAGNVTIKLEDITENSGDLFNPYLLTDAELNEYGFNAQTREFNFTPVYDYEELTIQYVVGEGLGNAVASDSATIQNFAALEFKTPTINSPYTFEGYTLDGTTSNPKTTFTFAELYANKDANYVVKLYTVAKKIVSINLLNDLHPSDIVFGDVHSEVSNEELLFTKAEDRVVSLSSLLSCNRDNYTLWRLKDNANKEYEFDDDITFVSGVNSIDLTPMWQGNTRVFDETKNYWTYFSGYFEGLGTIRQATTINLPTINDLNDDKNQYKTFIWKYKGEIVTGSFVVNEQGDNDVAISLELQVITNTVDQITFDLGEGYADKFVKITGVNSYSNQIANNSVELGKSITINWDEIKDLNGLKYISEFKIYKIVGENLTEFGTLTNDLSSQTSEFTFTEVGSYQFVAVYEDYNFKTEFKGTLLGEGVTDFGFGTLTLTSPHVENGDITFNYSEEQQQAFNINGYKLSYFKIVRNGEDETCVWGESFNDVGINCDGRFDAQNNYVITIEAVYVRDTQLIKFATAIESENLSYTKDEQTLTINIKDIIAANADQLTGAVFTIPSALETEIIVETITVDSGVTTVKKDLKHFAGWSKQEGSTTVNYNVGDTIDYSSTMDLTLYPVYTNYLSFTKQADGTYWVTGSSTAITEYDVPAELNGIPVTGVNKGAFGSKVTKIHLPASIKTLSNSAFVGCSKLESITFEEGIQLQEISRYSFNGCKALTSIIIPASVTTIAQSAFEGSGLIEITIPSTVTSVVSSSFRSCVNLKTVSFAEDINLKSISPYVFDGCSALESITLPESVTSINSNAFTGCTALKTVTLSKNLTTVSANAFSGSAVETIVYPEGTKNITASLTNVGLTNLKTIEIAASVEKINASVFSGLTTLTTVNFAEGSKLTTIDDYAFAYCSALESITIPNSVETIGESAFNSLNVKTITLPKNLKTLGANAFGESAIETVIYAEGTKEITASLKNTGLTNLKTINIPASVEKINASVFSGLTTLTTVNFAEGSALTTIGANAFSGCTSLKEITLPAGVKTLGANCFSTVESLSFAEGTTEIDLLVDNGGYNSFSVPFSSLKYVKIPSTVESIGEATFDGCTKLKTVVNLSDLPIHLGFENTEYGRLGRWADMIFKSDVVRSEEYLSNGIYYVTYTPKTGEKLSYNTYFNSEVQEASSYKVAIRVETQGLATYTIDQDTDGIGFEPFVNMTTTLTHITIPENVKTIGYHAFKQNFLLNVVVNLSDYIEVNPYAGNYGVGHLSFYLGEVYTENVTITNYENNGVKYYLIDYDADTGTFKDKIAYRFAAATAAEVTSLTLDNDTTVVAYNAFSGCAFETLNIPASVRKIQYKAFANNENLKQVVFEQGSNLTYLGGAFYSCTALESINLEDCLELEEIGYRLFSDCPSLEEYTLSDGTWYYKESEYSDSWTEITDQVLEGQTIAEFIKTRDELYFKRENV